MNQPDHKHARRIRSFVRRAGRLTPSQSRALEELWPEWGLEFGEAPIDLVEAFGREAPLVLEIGFGNGETMIEQASNDPSRNYLGIEVHEPGVGHCLLQIEKTGVTNVRLITHDAVLVLRFCVGDGALARLNLYFPDPWPKKRHHKRRLIQPTFLALVAQKLSRDGEMFIATDWENYAEHIDEVIAATGLFTIAARREHGGDRPLDRPTTKFERRGLKQGHRIWDWRLSLI